jgi:citrate/tricarballylate utilization protein
MEICNACRYCEGYCAVFPAMELRRGFTEADLVHLANLCHGCKGCYYACQYAPPHPFGLNLPRTFADLRRESYEAFAWPGALAGLFQRNGLFVSLATALALILVMVLSTLLISPETLTGAHRGPGAFYAVVPYGVMVSVAGLSFGYAVLALVMGLRNYWRASGAPAGAKAFALGLHDAMTLRNLGGGGHGCNDTDESFSQRRRWLHQAMMWGFLLCFAATSVATVYDHFFGWVAPYGWTSLPVLLGTVGGIGLTIGAGGLFWLKLTTDPAPVSRRNLGMDVALLALLFLVAVTGLALLVLRETGAMGTLLVIHLGFVLALFVTLPYGKFVHGLYRTAALVRHHADRAKGH